MAKCLQAAIESPESPLQLPAFAPERSESAVATPARPSKLSERAAERPESAAATLGFAAERSEFLLVAGFSLGLALTLAGLGVLLVCAKKWSDRLPARNRFLQEQLPFASAAIVALVGFVIALRGLQQI